jgi:hypothetical protein
MRNLLSGCAAAIGLVLVPVARSAGYDGETMTVPVPRADR